MPVTVLACHVSREVVTLLAAMRGNAVSPNRWCWVRCKSCQHLHMDRQPSPDRPGCSSSTRYETLPMLRQPPAAILLGQCSTASACAAGSSRALGMVNLCFHLWLLGKQAAKWNGLLGTSALGATGTCTAFEPSSHWPQSLESAPIKQRQPSSSGHKRNFSDFQTDHRPLVGCELSILLQAARSVPQGRGCSCQVQRLHVPAVHAHQCCCKV
mgnify:CR=1 FL=1